MSDTRDLLPEMLDPADVCSAMDDLAFMEYCYSHFDVNHDHKVGLHEARAVREIDLSDSKVVSLRGIEYFTNLERLILDRSMVKELDLRQNTKLKEISAKECSHLNNTELPNGLSVIPNNEIWYTSTDGKIIEPRNTDAFGANIVSNTYENGKGIISFDGDVTSIGFNAFYKCTSLTSITIPDSVTSIGEDAFYECNSLTSTTIGNGITSIGEDAFYGCTGELTINCNIDAISVNYGESYHSHFSDSEFTKIIIGNNSIVKIESWAFSYCRSLKSVTIGNGVTSIGHDAFAFCDSLTSITIPESVTEIGESAFAACLSLTSVHITDIVAWCGIIRFGWYRDKPPCYACNLYLNGKLVTDLVIPESVTDIGSNVFRGCKSLRSVTIPSSVTSIGVDAFQGCTSLASIIIPDSVTEIGGEAFYGCTSLSSITIPDSVTTIGSSAFYNCKSLKSVTIPDSVTDIGLDAFNGCSSLPIENNVRYADTYLVEVVDKTQASYNIKEGTRFIRGGAFSGCLSLTSITIPDSVIEIGDEAFRECSSLTCVTIGNGVTSIGRSAFSGCKLLTSITIPDSVTSIGNYAFANCTSLTSINIPNSVTEIGDGAFLDCTSLTSVYCEVTIPPVGSSYMFLYIRYGNWITIGCKIYVPRQSVEAYKSAKGWKRYAYDIVGYDFEAEKKSVAVEQMDKSPYYLFFDTETTGLPKNFKAPASETYNWPRMVQLAWIVANKQGDILKKKSCIIRPEGYTISSSAAEVHGITTEKALREGDSLKKVLAEFGEDLAAAKVLVAHNMAFDKKIVHAEYIRLGCEDVWMNGPTERICTMMSSIDYCALPGFYDDYKWPKLQELHEKLFGYEFDDAHDALADIEATFKCYWELRKLGLIE